MLKAIEAAGYTAVFVPIHWERTTIDDWLTELEAVYARYEPSNTVLAGFSYGSMTAFLAATKRVPAELWLFSFSPYFSDDLPKLKKSWKRSIGHRRIAAFSKLDFNRLAASITCPTIIMIGSIEVDKYPLITNRTRIAKQQIKNNRYIIAAGASHNVTEKTYIAAIAKALARK